MSKNEGSKEKTCKRIKQLIDVKVTIDPPAYIWDWARGDMEKVARDCEAWANEFQAFIRDHRSRDEAGIAVERVLEDQCSVCARAWEPSEDGTYCVGCGADIDTEVSK